MNKLLERKKKFTEKPVNVVKIIPRKLVDQWLIKAGFTKRGDTWYKQVEMKDGKFVAKV